MSKFFQIAILSNEVTANVTVPAENHEMILLVTGMAPGIAYPLQIRAVNQMGSGPPGEAKLVLDPELFQGAFDSPMMSYHNSVVGKRIGYNRFCTY